MIIEQQKTSNFLWSCGQKAKISSKCHLQRIRNKSFFLSDPMGHVIDTPSLLKILRGVIIWSRKEMKNDNNNERVLTIMMRQEAAKKPGMATEVILSPGALR